MTQYTYLPRLSTGCSPAFDTVGAAARGGTSRMTRDPARPLFGAAFLSTVRDGRAAVRRGGPRLGGHADLPSPGGPVAPPHRCDLLPQALREELAVHLPVVGEVVHDEDQRRLRRRRRRLALLRRLRPARGHARLTSRGTTSVNVEPPPTSLSSVIPPSSMSARRRQMASPRPAPVYSRVGELSAWRKSSKIRSRSSAEMPMPVSATAIAIWSPSGMYPARTSTDPRGVNLMALVRKLMTICLTFCRSVLSCGTSAASWLVTASCERAMIGSASARHPA